VAVICVSNRVAFSGGTCYAALKRQQFSSSSPRNDSALHDNSDILLDLYGGKENGKTCRIAENIEIVMAGMVTGMDGTT